jgi:hypothetical protein
MGMDNRPFQYVIVHHWPRRGLVSVMPCVFADIEAAKRRAVRLGEHETQRGHRYEVARMHRDLLVVDNREEVPPDADAALVVHALVARGDL